MDLRLSRRRLPEQRYPLGLELAYVPFLHDTVRGMQGDALAVCAERLPELLERAKPTRRDAAADDLAAAEGGPTAPSGWAALLESLLSVVALRATVRLQLAASAIPKMGRAVDAHSIREWKRLVRAAYGVDVLAGDGAGLRPLLSAWEAQNLDLITRMSADTIARLRGVVVQAVVEGRSLRVVTADVQAAYGVSRTRSELIARDQIGKLTGQMQQHRQQEAGVRQYRWSSVGDRRVRPQHKAQNGKVYSWDKPPPGGHPGQPIRCRCGASPIFPKTLTVTP